jgi:hypothetical protein
MTTEMLCFYLQNRLIQTSQTRGQWYNDTSHFSIPCKHTHTHTHEHSLSLSHTHTHTYTPPGNTKGGSITVPLTSCLTGLQSAV